MRIVSENLNQEKKATRNLNEETRWWCGEWSGQSLRALALDQRRIVSKGQGKTVRWTDFIVQSLPGKSNSWP